MMTRRRHWVIPVAMLAALGVVRGHAQGLVITPLPSQQVIPAVAPPAMPSGAPSVPDPAPVARAGLPQASIIVGDLAVLAAFDPRGPLGLPFAVRQSIHERDAGLFDRLLGQGAFDPDQDRLAEAIQSELARMNCYAGGVDGAWGAGSARAVTRWSQVAKADAASTPAVPLYRAIARDGDLRCASPTPAAAPAAVTSQPARSNTPARAANTARNPGPRANQAAQSGRRASPQPTPPATAAPTRQINPSLMGSGLFR